MMTTIGVRGIRSFAILTAAGVMASSSSGAATKTLSPGAEHRVPRSAFIPPDMLQIPGGTFIMGSPMTEQGRSPDEGPQHRVTIPTFMLSRNLVTFDDWDACVADGGCKGYKPSDQRWGRGKRPVINVNWFEVQTYLTWVSHKTGIAYRLPTEAEWEYAARAGTTTARYWGEAPGDQQCLYANGLDRSAKGKTPASGVADAVNCDDGYPHTSPVGSFKPNSFGLYDMLGNVFQWTTDCYHKSYNGAPADNAPWTSGTCLYRVSRGGSWLLGPPFLRAAFRDTGEPKDRFHNVGFRLASGATERAR